MFLFDGSASMTEEEFRKNKEFIRTIMKSLNGTSVKVSAPSVIRAGARRVQRSV